MTTSEINISLIGKRVKGNFTAMEVTGTVTEIIDTEHSAGVRIELDEPVQWGRCTYTHFDSTARKTDDWGNLEFTELI